MVSLFSDDFPDDCSNEELEALIKQYPNYDEYYVVSGSIKERREKFNKLWALYEPHCDSHFLLQVKRDFHARTWEMYLGNVLLNAGFRIASNDHGPDITLASSIPPVWIEAIAVTKGQGPDAVPESPIGVVSDVPQDKMLLRLTKALDDKSAKYRGYLAQGIVAAKDPFVIAVNRGLLGHGDPECPLIFKCLFSLGYLEIPVRIGGGQAGRPYMSRRETVQKLSGSPVSLSFFEKPENVEISAVLYSATTVLNHPLKIGGDCILVHNPKATNPLDQHFFQFLEQWELREVRSGDYKIQPLCQKH